MHPHPNKVEVDEKTLAEMSEVMDQMMVIIGGAQVVFMIGAFILLVIITSWFRKVLKEAHAALIYWNEAQHSLNKDPCTDRDKTDLERGSIE